MAEEVKPQPVEGEVLQQEQLPIEELVKRHEERLVRIEKYLGGRQVQEQIQKQFAQKQMEEAQDRRVASQLMQRDKQQEMKKWQTDFVEAQKAYASSSVQRKGLISTLGYIGALSLSTLVGSLLGFSGGFVGIIGASILRGLPQYRMLEAKINEMFDKRDPKWRRMEHLKSLDPRLPENQQLNGDVEKYLEAAKKIRIEAQAKAQEGEQNLAEKKTEMGIGQTQPASREGGQPQQLPPELMQLIERARKAREMKQQGGEGNPNVGP